ncbi:hypothetical protein [Paenibacillus alvei]|uniref:Uncharacterized protein n=1 Tax=Paenibacillus alvei TaxID=44250 RepID=A0A383RJA5_PAEAL|nr:hypothetical protein [Paenibacillus alvei]SYX86449.1 conserved protein of unknown function [Paenibacillus alvei]
MNTIVKIIFGVHSSYFTVKHDELFNDTESKIFKWFVFRHEKLTEDFANYIPSLRAKEIFLNDTRNMWCAPILTMINGSYNDYYKEYVNRNGFIDNPIGFEKRKLEFSKDGVVTEGKGNEIMVLKIEDRDNYEGLSKFILKDIISKFEK